MSAIASIADKLSLELETTDRGLRVSRHGLDFEMQGPDEENSAATRARWFHRLLGVRYGLDRRSGNFDFSLERPTGDEKPRNTYERRSVYGERLQRLIPRLAHDWAEAVCGERLFTTEWSFDEFTVAYIYEIGRIWHVWAEDDFEFVEFDAENLTEFGRLALFYERYKPRPSEEKFAWGRLRTYRSNEGLTASQALLLPDFDYDAAAARGYFALPSRDCMFVVEPLEDGHDLARTELRNRLSAEFENALLPLSNDIFELERTSIAGRVGPKTPIVTSLEDDVWSPAM